MIVDKYIPDLENLNRGYSQELYRVLLYLYGLFSPWNVSLENSHARSNNRVCGVGMTFTMFDISCWSMLPNLAGDPKERNRFRFRGYLP